jgi:pyruvate dehydrogenase E2 component (dihydrolipoamide acetyltransferase)/2-oxoisovalerate dehydrogenase E2 component (dihydrolipoyl transacylase)
MDFQLPELGEGVYEAELVSWRVKVGDRVKRDQPLMEVLTDKATMEVPAAFAGTITALAVEPGVQMKIGEKVLSYTPAGAAEPAEAPAASDKKAKKAQKATANAAVSESPPSAARTENGPPAPATLTALAVKAAPSVRFMARKLGVDLGQVRGSGPGGRVLVEDLTRVLQSTARLPTGDRSERQESPSDYGKPGTRIKLLGLRRKIAEHMVQSKRTIPHYSYVDECEVTDLVRLRDSLRDTFAQAGVKLTYLAFFVKAVVQALKEIPIVNASLNEEAGEIVLHDRYHIGVAVATPAGLIVPVVHDADRKSIAELARDIERLSAAARAGKVAREDLLGSVFTITSIGGIGGLITTPIINYPEVGILGIGKVVKRPIYDATGNLRPADLLYLSFSFDHRVLDGAIGAAFGNAVIRRLQNPAMLLLPEKLL